MFSFVEAWGVLWTEEGEIAASLSICLTLYSGSRLSSLNVKACSRGKLACTFRCWSLVLECSSHLAVGRQWELGLSHSCNWCEEARWPDTRLACLSKVSLIGFSGIVVAAKAYQVLGQGSGLLHRECIIELLARRAPHNGLISHSWRLWLDLLNSDFPALLFRFLSSALSRVLFDNDVLCRIRNVTLCS